MKYTSALPALGIALAVLGPGSFARAQGDFPITVAKPADQLCLSSADQGEYATGAIAFAGEGTEARKEAAEGLGKPPPKLTINTHNQVEYVGGNAVVGNEPALIARELTPLKLQGREFRNPEIGTDDVCSIAVNTSAKPGEDSRSKAGCARQADGKGAQVLHNFVWCECLINR